MDQANSLYTQLDDYKKQKVDARLSVLFRHHQRIISPFLVRLYHLRREELSKMASEGTL